jgi:hypothetical protein
MTEGALLAGLIGLGRRAADGQSADQEPVVLSNRADGLVVRVGDVVVKAHAPETDPTELRARLRVAADPLLDGVLLPPLAIPAGSGLYTQVGDRLATVWPAGEPVGDADPEAAPWAEAGSMLARLHATPQAGLPSVGRPRRLARAMGRLRSSPASPAAEEVTRAFDTLPQWARRFGGSGREVVVHGDWHLGQLVCRPQSPAGNGDAWLLIDVDDLGLGDPVWDLARSAAWYLVGFLAPPDWSTFLSAYRAAGGRALPPEGDPWPVLDVPARALAIQMAALAVAAAGCEDRLVDDLEGELVAACRRISLLGAAR